MVVDAFEEVLVVDDVVVFNEVVEVPAVEDDVLTDEFPVQAAS